MRCLTCHYELKKLPVNRCPECGRQFDPKDRSTFHVDPPRRRLSWQRKAIFTACTVVAAAITLTFLLIQRGDPLRSIITGSVFWLILILAVILLYDFLMALAIGLRRRRSKADDAN